MRMGLLVAALASPLDADAQTWTAESGALLFTPSARLGVTVKELTSLERRVLGAPADVGVLVTAVDPGGPAALVGVRAGDLILSIDDHAIDVPMEFHAHTLMRRQGDRVSVLVFREGRSISIAVRLAPGFDHSR
jgi:S1-C subfamily serine protease